MSRNGVKGGSKKTRKNNIDKSKGKKGPATPRTQRSQRPAKTRKAYCPGIRKNEKRGQRFCKRKEKKKEDAHTPGKRQPKGKTISRKNKKKRS